MTEFNLNVFDELHEILSRKGLYKILGLLKYEKVGKDGMEKKTFNGILKLKINTNLFRRIKDELFKLKLIKEYTNDKGTKMIKLTKKGSHIYDTLIYLKLNLFEDD